MQNQAQLCGGRGCCSPLRADPNGFEQKRCICLWRHLHFWLPGGGLDENRDSWVQFGLPSPAELAFPKPDPELELFLQLENIPLSTLTAAFHVSELRSEVSRQSGSIFSPR